MSIKEEARRIKGWLVGPKLSAFLVIILCLVMAFGWSRVSAEQAVHDWMVLFLGFLIFFIWLVISDAARPDLSPAGESEEEREKATRRARLWLGGVVLLVLIAGAVGIWIFSDTSRVERIDQEVRIQLTQGAQTVLTFVATFQAPSPTTMPTFMPTINPTARIIATEQCESCTCVTFDNGLETAVDCTPTAPVPIGTPSPEPTGTSNPFGEFPSGS